MHRKHEIQRVLAVSLGLNVLVAGLKIVFGLLTNSVAILSDGFHSIFDGASNILGLIGVHLSSHPPDERHPYGHRKYETIFTIFIGVLMFITCLEIMKNAYESFIRKHTVSVMAESFTVMLITMSVNIFVATYERRAGRRLKSEFLIADSAHMRSDIFVTVGVIVSLVLIKLGLSWADSIAGIVVGIVIAKAGIGIIKEATDVLVDHTRSDISLIRGIVCHIDGVAECHEIRTRGTRSHVFVDAHVLVKPSMSVEQAHQIADTIEDELKRKIPEVVDVIIHIEPFVCDRGDLPSRS